MKHTGFARHWNDETAGSTAVPNPSKPGTGTAATLWRSQTPLVTLSPLDNGGNPMN
jgi:hypothetical protein